MGLLIRLHCAAGGSFLLRVSHEAGGSPFHSIYVPGGRKGDRKLPYLLRRLNHKYATLFAVHFSKYFCSLSREKLTRK